MSTDTLPTSPVRLFDPRPAHRPLTSATHAGTLTEQVLLASADRVLHAARSCDRPHLGADDLAVAWQGDRGFFTNVAYPLVEPDRWDDLLARIGEIVPADRPLTLVSPFAVPDLSGRGWALVGHPPLMVRPAGPAPAARVPAELTIHEVTDEPALEVFERTLVDAYPDPSLQPYAWGRELDGRVLGGPTRFFTGFVAGRPVATAAGHVAAGVDLVEMVATSGPARGCGYGEAVTWAATLADPHLPSVLLASDLGRPVYQRMGYTAVTRWTIWHRPG
jgi:hypothetical protein